MRKILLLLEILLISICCFFDSFLYAQCKRGQKSERTNSEIDTLIFGNNVNASFGLDSLSPTVIEYEAPPWPFCNTTRWVLPGRPSFSGMAPYDFRGIPAAPLHKDTFALTVVDDYNLYLPMQLRWPPRSYLSARCDSLVLVDRRGKILPVDMFSQDSLVVAPKEEGVSYFYIFKYGANLVDTAPPPSSSVFWVLVTYRYTTDAVGREETTTPMAFSLKQNYPNPFNPSTFIGFHLPATCLATLKVYDILGREMATLVNGKREPGEYGIQWNAEYIPGGVYFYRLIAGDFVETKKMMILR